MRTDEGDEQRPRPIAMLGRLLAQPDLRTRRDLPIVEGVGRLSRPRHLGDLPRSAAHRQVLAHQAHQVALAVDDVHRDLRLGEADIVLRIAEVQLADGIDAPGGIRSEEHTSELQSLMRISYAVFCLKKKKKEVYSTNPHTN